VVQTPLELLQQLRARYPLELDRFLEVIPELAFLGEVDAFGFLFFAQLQTVAYNLGLLVFPVLSGSEVAFLNRTFVAEALGAFEEELDPFPATKTTYCIGITCHCSPFGNRFTGWRPFRPDLKIVLSSQFSVLRKPKVSSALTENRELGTENCLLHSPPFRRPASIMRNRRRVLNGPHFDARRSQRAHRRLPPRSRTAHPHIHRAHSVIARHAGSVRRGLLRRKRSP